MMSFDDEGMLRLLLTRRKKRRAFLGSGSSKKWRPDRTEDDTVDLAWATLQLISSRKQESRKSRVRGQIESWLGTVRAAIKEAVSAGTTETGKKQWEKDTLNTIEKRAASVQIKFTDGPVRDRLLRLMGSETVRILDRDFMARLSTRLTDRNWEKVQGRIDQRKKFEVERERQLIMQGQLPPSKQDLTHPYFVIMNSVAAEVAKKKAKKARQVRRKMGRIDYSGVIGRLPSEDEEIIEKFEESDEEVKDLLDIPEQSEDNSQRTGEDLEPEPVKTIRYEDPSIKELRDSKTVDEMYQMADEIFFRLFPRFAAMEEAEGKTRPPSPASSESY